MKKRIMSFVLCAALLLCALPMGLFGLTASAAYKVGSTYTFGSYPQTDVTATLGAKLNALGGSWTSYGYGTTSDGKKQLMLYKDVTYNGAKYRGVTINGLRGSSHLYNNYLAGNVYWFKWEPVKWRVLDPSTGFILCNMILDSQPFQSSLSSGHNESGQTIYPCNYAESNIRTWLNQTFLNTAFSSDEKAAIQSTTLDNTSALSSLYDASTTNDKIFLLSYTEATNSAYGFRSEDFDTTDTDFNRLKEGSDYAKCQGLWYCYDAYSLYENYSYWWLRTPYSPIYACGVEYDSRVFTNELVNHTNYGVCPAIKIGNLNAGVTLQSIAIQTMPAKTTYNKGESLDPTGLTLTAKYSDGDTKTITSGFTFTGFNAEKAGVQAITVTYQGLTATFNVTVLPDASDPVIAIHNYADNKTVDYKTTITFSVDEVQNPVSGAEVHWFIDDQDAGTGNTITVKQAKKSFSIQAMYMKDGEILAQSAKETVNVKTGFFAKLKAFFRGLFGKLPVIVQAYLGVETIDK